MNIVSVTSKVNVWASGYFDASVKYSSELDSLSHEDVDIIGVAANHFQNYVAYNSDGRGFHVNRTYYYGYVNGLYAAYPNIRGAVESVFNAAAEDEFIFLIAARLFEADIVKTDYIMFQIEGEKICRAK